MPRSVITLSLILIGILLIFQFNNCTEAPPQSFGGASFDSMGNCSGPNCVKALASANLLSLEIGGSVDEIRVPMIFNQIDMVGTCDPSSYPRNEVWYQLIDDVSGQVRVQDQGGACVNGRFNFTVKPPPDFFAAFPHQHSLVVELVAYDSYGNKYDYPLRAKKVVKILFLSQ